MGAKKLSSSRNYTCDVFPQSFINALKGTILDRDLRPAEPLPKPGQRVPING